MSSAWSAVERQGRQRPALLDDRVKELDGHVLRVGGAPAVAHARTGARRAQKRSAMARTQRLDPAGLAAEELLLDLAALARLAQDGLLHRIASA